MLQNLLWNQDKIIFALIALVVVTFGSALIMMAYREFKKIPPPVKKTESAPAIVQPETPPQVVYKEIVKPEIHKVSRTDSGGIFSTTLLVAIFFIAGNFSSQYFDINSHLNVLFNKQPQQIVAVDTSQQGLEMPVQETKTVTQAPPTVHKSVGDTFVLWNMQYQVLSATNKGSTLNYQKSSGKFIEVVIKATNVEKDEIGLNKIYLEDGQGRHFETNPLIFNFSSGFNQYGMTKDYKGIPPGFSETFIATFEVPIDATGLALKYPSAQGPVALSVDLGL